MNKINYLSKVNKKNNQKQKNEGTVFEGDNNKSYCCSISSCNIF